MHIHEDKSGGSAVGIATADCLDDCGVGDRVQLGSRICTSPYIQINSGAQSASYRMSTAGIFPPRVERPGCEYEQSHPISAEIKEMWIYTSTPPYASRHSY
jgi:hypothetical protein